ncbi:Transposase [Cordylochernes scorpioides]|uniref:Transposase n=1 Tax=Cordylochernes scorpioides TaxID=51811 RepID=A0ABY6KDM4_9ARAC|nr:Transposase [Cordylochernes scorpioides]
MAKTKKEKDAEFTYQAMPTFVKYNNSLNIKTWITNFERKSDSYGLDHGWKVLHLSDYLQDEALTYYFESLCNIEDWGKLKESLIIRFQKVKLTPLVEMMRITQEEQETVTEYFHRKMQLINNVELNLTSIVELLNEGVKTKYKPYLATVDAVQPSEWLTMAIKVENSLTGSGTPVEKGRLQTLNPALHPSPRPAGYYGNSQVQRPPMPCRICERLGLELQWHYHSVCPYRNPTASRSFPPPTPRVQRPTASRSFPSATPHSYQAAASSSFPPPTPHDYQPTVASASSPDSPRTISRRLVANGLHSCRPLRRLPLTPPNRRQRLEWCRARSTWMTEWHRVVFSDESRFCLSSDSRRVRVWRRRGERSNPAAIVERPTVRQRGIMVWGAIAYDSRSPLLRNQGTMTAQRYVDDVLRPVTLPYLQGVPNALYQQDNARLHTAHISQQALQDVQMLPWPPYSPDLSPIEHVWDIIGRRLHAFSQPRSEDELWQMVEREWRAIPQDAIRTLIDSLPRRVAACIAVRGGPTCY